MPVGPPNKEPPPSQLIGRAPHRLRPVVVLRSPWCPTTVFFCQPSWVKPHWPTGQRFPKTVIFFVLVLIPEERETNQISEINTSTSHSDYYYILFLSPCSPFSQRWRYCSLLIVISILLNEGLGVNSDVQRESAWNPAYARIDTSGCICAQQLSRFWRLQSFSKKSTQVLMRPRTLNP